jgi:hypothetical protein
MIYVGDYLGDFIAGAQLYRYFNTVSAALAPQTLSGTPVVSVYKNGSTTESTTGVTLTVDFDSRTGLHQVLIDTGTDLTFYSSGSDFEIVLTAGTSDGVSVVGRSLGKFSLHARSALRPTIGGRTLDVSAGGEAGIDWANIGSPTTTVNLSGTSTLALEPTTANRKLDVSTGGEAGIDWANIGSPTTVVGLTGTSTRSLQPTVLGRTLDVASGGEAGVDWGNIANQNATVFLTGTAIGAVLGNVVGSVGSVAATVNADVVKISGDTTAADHLETMLDGTGGSTLSLGTLAVIANGADAIAVNIQGIGANAVGMFLSGTSGAIAMDGGVAITGDISTSGRISATDDFYGDLHGDVTGTVQGADTGVGAHAITVLVTDGTNPLQNASVRVSEGASALVGTTDSNGHAHFSLDSGTYTVTATKGGYSFTPTTRTVTGDEAGTITQAIAMTQVSIPGAPSDPSLCRVYGDIRDLRTNKLLKGVTVTAKLASRGMVYAGGFLVGVEKSAVTDSMGRFQLDIPQSDVMDPPSNWRIICKEAGIDTIQTLNGATFDLSTIV